MTGSVPHRSVKSLRVVGTHHQIDRSHGGVNVKLFLPGLAAILGAVDPAFLVGRVFLARCGDVNYVRVGWVNDNSRDVVRIGQSQMLPGLASVF